MYFPLQGHFLNFLQYHYHIYALGPQYWYVTPCSPVKFTDVSEEHTATSFRVDPEDGGSTVL
jgi:hypothetical protein